MRVKGVAMDSAMKARIDAGIARAKAAPPEEIARISELEQRRVVAEYEEFKRTFSEGRCYLCNSPLKTFSESKPCLHWLLHPKGFKKKSLPILFGRFGYFQMESYLRWIANLDQPLKNINDLSDEKNPNKLIETTIKYKHLEWTFSCAPGDFEGHENSASGKFPHFHFQMRIDKKPFISFNDYHIPFLEEDIWKLKLIAEPDSKFQHRFTYGESLENLFEEIPLETIIDTSEATDDESQAALNFSTLVMAKPGETIKGEDIYNLYQESKETGLPMAKLLRKLDADVTTIVSPGSGVPELAKRSGRGSSKKSEDA